MTNPMTNPMTMPVAVTGPHPAPAAPVTLAAATDAGTGRCGNCGSVRSVRVLPDGRHRCDCGHRWTPPPTPPLTGRKAGAGETAAAAPIWGRNEKVTREHARSSSRGRSATATATSPVSPRSVNSPGSASRSGG